MADGKWQMANGRWQMAKGKWQMAKGKWQMANRQSGKPAMDKSAEDASQITSATRSRIIAGAGEIGNAGTGVCRAQPTQKTP